MEEGGRFINTAGSKRSRLLARLRSWNFDDGELESLYGRYAYTLRRSWTAMSVVFLLIHAGVWGALQIGFSRTFYLPGILHLGLAGVLAVLAIVVHTRVMSRRRLAVFAYILLVFYVPLAVVSWPLGLTSWSLAGETRRVATDGVWQTCLVVYVIYVTLPVRTAACVCVGIVVTCSHVVFTALLGDIPPLLFWRQIISNSVIFLSVNLVGAYVHVRLEHAHRRAFLAVRGWTASRLQVEDNTERLDKLLCCMVPQHIARQMKSDPRWPHEGLRHDTHAQKHDFVSVLSADLVGFSLLASQCTAQDFVNMLNQVFGRFDQLATEHHCSRFRLLGDNYLCVCGLPDARPDHARCCVELGLDLVETVLTVRDIMDVDVSVRIGIHSGSVTCGIIGERKWQFDVWGDTVTIARKVEESGVAGRVHITETTLDYLHNDYDVEPTAAPTECGNLQEQTYLISASFPRRHNSFCRSKTGSQGRGRPLAFSTMSGSVTRLMQSLRNHADVPLACVLCPAQVEERPPTGTGGKITDKIRKPFKKRLSSMKGVTDRVNRQLANSISTGSVHKPLHRHVNCFTLSFLKSGRERKYYSIEDGSFSSRLLCALFLLIASASCQALVLPRTQLLLVVFLAAFVWICTVLICVLANKLKCMRCSLHKSAVLRIIVMINTILLVYAVAQVNVFCCQGSSVFPALFNMSTSARAWNSDLHLFCPLPRYVYITSIFAFIIVAVFVRLSVMIKLVLMLLMATGYMVVIFVTHPKLFTDYDHTMRLIVPSYIEGVVVVTEFVLVIFVQAHRHEWLYRLRFLWDLQSGEESMESAELQSHTRHLLGNLLPNHASAHILDTAMSGHLGLYSQTYARVAVLFTSVPAFSDVYAELSAQGRGEDSIHVLGQIIADFDQLLTEDRFRGLEKLHSQGTQYVIAAGLTPNLYILETDDSQCLHLTIVMEFVSAMREKLLRINQQLATSLQLKAGLHIGPVLAGVVGSRKPQFDVWGSTVNMAALTELYSKPNHIQVTEDVYRPLRQRYHFQCRGPIALKNHGEITTYYLIGRKSMHSPSPSSVSHVNVNDFSWFKRLSQTSGGGFALEDHSGSLHSCGDSKIRLASLNGSRDNIVPTLVPSLGRSRIPSDSVRGTVGATPPGSLTRKQQQQQQLQQQQRNNKNSDSRENVSRGHRKLSNTSLTSNDFSQRVGSPELPMVHFRNINLPGSSSLPRADNNFGVNTLTQAAFMSSVQENRGANSASKQVPDSPRLTHSNPHKKSDSYRATQDAQMNNGKLPDSPKSTLNPTARATDSPHLSSASAPQIWHRSESPKILNGLTPPPRVQSSPKVNNAIQVQRSTDSPRVKTNGSFKSKSSPVDPGFINNKGFGSGGRKKIINLESLQQQAMSVDSYNGMVNGALAGISKMKPIDGGNSMSSNSNPRFGGVPLERVSESPTPDSTPHGSPEKVPLNVNSMQQPMRCRGGGIIAAQEINLEKFKIDASDPNVVKESMDSPNKVRPKKINMTAAQARGNNSPESIVAHKPPMHKQGSRSPEDKMSASPHMNMNNHSGGSPPHSSSSTSSSSSECTSSSNISTPESLGPHATTSPLYASNPLYGELPATPNNKRTNGSTSSSSPVVKENNKSAAAQQQKPVSRIPVRQSGICISNPMNAISPTENKPKSVKQNNNSKIQPPKQQKKEPRSEIPKPSKLARLTKQQSLPETNNLDKVVSSNAQKFGTNAAGCGVPGSKSSIAMVTSAENIGFRPITTSPQTESTPTTLCNSDDEESPPPLPPPPSESALRGGNLTKPDPLHGKLLAYHKPDYPEPCRQNGKVKPPQNKPPLPPSSIPVPQSGNSYKNEKLPSPGGAESPDPTCPLIPLSPSKVDQPPSFQVKRRQPHKAPPRLCRSLDYIPSDIEEAASGQTSPMHSPKQTHDLFPSAPFMRKYFLPDNLSLSSLGSSEMSRSDPAINYDSGSAAYESEYDNYRPGMASDEDYFIPEPISDMDIDIFDDINIDNVTVSDTYSVDMPLPKKKKVPTATLC